MNVYIYQTELLCQECGEATRRHLRKLAPQDVGDESSYDSDHYPKGPFPNGGGEADSPQHCGICGVFLENPLTDEGVEYVVDCIKRWLDLGYGNPEALTEWSEEILQYNLSPSDKGLVESFLD